MTDSTILKGELLEIAAREKLRLRAFGETVIFGHHKPFDGDSQLALAALSAMIDGGQIGVYRDEDGLFVGPTDPDLIDTMTDATADLGEVAHGV